MAIVKPDTLRNCLFPTFFFYRIFGMGIIEYPIGRPRRILGFIYSSTMTICYGIALFPAYNMVFMIANHLSSSIAKFAYTVFPVVIYAMVTGDFVNCLFRNKEHNHCVMELMDIDAVMRTMCVTRTSQSSLRQRIAQLVGCLFIIFIMGFMDYFYITMLSPINAASDLLWFWYIFQYPVLISTFGDLAFCAFNKVLAQYFKDLNSLLQSMKIQRPDDYDTRMGNLIRVDVILEDKEKLEKLCDIRKIYSRLVKLARLWTKLNGLHVISGTVIAIWIGTIETYSIYNMSFTPGFNFKQSLRYGRTFQSIIVHIVKLYILVWPTKALISEARRTGGILLNHLQPIGFLRTEVNEFALQLIQNPLRLSAGGLVDLDYSLVQMVITSVATYLVVLVQTHSL